MAEMTLDDVHGLSRLLSGLRPDWNPQSILGAVHALRRTRGHKLSSFTIGRAALFYAEDPDNLGPERIGDDGDHWYAAAHGMLDAPGGRGYRDQHSRRVLTEARRARDAADPLVAAAGAAAARRALAAMRSAG